MALFGLFSSESKSDHRSEVSDKTNVNTANDNGQIYSNTMGDIRVTGGGKKSTTNVVNNIQYSDYGAIKSGEKIALAGIDQSRGAFDASLEFASQALDFGETGLSQGFGLISKNTAAAVSDGLNKVLVFAGFAVAAFVVLNYVKGK